MLHVPDGEIVAAGIMKRRAEDCRNSSALKVARMLDNKNRYLRNHTACWQLAGAVWFTAPYAAALATARK